MSYRKQFNISTSLNNRQDNFLTEMAFANSGRNVNSNYVSHLPEVYSGAPNRVERYNQYEAMDLDSHINASLDIIAEFCTQVDANTKLPFLIQHTEAPTDRESKILAQMLRGWVNTNDFDNRLFDIVRKVLKYGDQFFVRDPETFRLNWIYQGNVIKVIVNEALGKKPEQYVVRDLDYNAQALSVSQIPNTYQGSMPSVPGATLNNTNYNTRIAQGSTSTSRFSNGQNEFAVNAEHIVHLNMNNGTDPNWPFGTSILEQVFKSYKQKELIEDSILIYRIQRAPQRRIFYVDVGDLPEHKAMAYVEQMKNSVNQRRIPNKTGGGQNIMDASYNPISILDDYFFPQRPDGRGSKIDTLPGGETSWGTDELRYFDNKLARGLRVPSSYLPTGPDDSPATYNDGKVGSALIQEYRFSKYCERIQRSLIRVLDEEFKLYLKNRDVAIDSSSFNLQFIEPQSFVTWRQVELDSARINNFNSVQGLPYISKRYAMLHFLGWTMEDINKNNSMLMEEQPSKFAQINDIKGAALGSSAPVDLRNIGINKNEVFDEPLETGIPEITGTDEPTTDDAGDAGAAGDTPPVEPLV